MAGTNDIKKVQKYGMIEWKLGNGQTQWRIVVNGSLLLHKECGGQVVPTSKPTDLNCHVSICELCGAEFVIPDLWAGE